MKTLNTFLVSAFLATTMSGCVIVSGDRDWDDNDSWEHRQQTNRDTISNLQMKASRDSVVAKLGVPSFSDAFVKDGREYRVLYYRTQRTVSDGETTRDETTPLVFENDQLIGWGHESLANIR
jgi:outer membrane protein assembly factor BamE (lipoprotein component of BamABCDE complex)